jgi:hypothetical protein
LLREDAKEASIKKYLLIVQLYEYLAFAHALASSTKYLGRWRTGKFWESIRNRCLDRWLIASCSERSFNRISDNYFDPYGEQWLKRWVSILIEDPDFPHVHQSYESDHPEFYRFVEDEIKEIMLLKRIIELKNSGCYEQEIVDRLAGEGIVDRDNRPVRLSSMKKRYGDYKRNVDAAATGNKLPPPYDYISWKC